MGKHHPPTNRGRSKGSKKRRRRKRPIPLPRVRAPPKPPKKPWERKTIALKIIVLTYNRANSLQRLLRSLQAVMPGEKMHFNANISVFVDGIASAIFEAEKEEFMGVSHVKAQIFKGVSNMPLQMTFMII